MRQQREIPALFWLLVTGVLLVIALSLAPMALDGVERMKRYSEPPAPSAPLVVATSGPVIQIVTAVPPSAPAAGADGNHERLPPTAPPAVPQIIIVTATPGPHQQAVIVTAAPEPVVIEAGAEPAVVEPMAVDPWPRPLTLEQYNQCQTGCDVNPACAGYGVCE
jgi:hypothetical protein